MITIGNLHCYFAFQHIVNVYVRFSVTINECRKINKDVHKNQKNAFSLEFDLKIVKCPIM